MIFNFKIDSKEFDSSSLFRKRSRARTGGKSKQNHHESFDDHISRLRMDADKVNQDAGPNDSSKNETSEM